MAETAAVPRLAETPDALWAAIESACLVGRVCRANGSRWTYARLVLPSGDILLMQGGGEVLLVAGSAGLGTLPAPPSVLGALHAAVAQDRVRVVLMTTPGFGSGYRAPRVLEVLHEPTGWARPDCAG